LFLRTSVALYALFMATLRPVKLAKTMWETATMTGTAHLMKNNSRPARPSASAILRFVSASLTTAHGIQMTSHSVPVSENAQVAAE